jgi:hypothetical protein
MVAAVSILMAGHLSQIVMWSITYAFVGAMSSRTGPTENRYRAIKRVVDRVELPTRPNL